MKKIIVSLLLLSVLLVPVLVFAQPNVTASNLDQLIDTVKKPLWMMFGLIALIVFVVFGILLLIAAGNPDKVSAARAAFLWGVFTVVMGIVAYSIVSVIEISF